MQLRIKKLNPEAKLPSYAHSGDAGLDLYSLEEVIVPPGQIGRFKTGIAMEIPPGYVGLCWDKSGLSANHGLKVLGGVIDSSFRGELVLAIVNHGQIEYKFAKHQKVMQLLIQPVENVEVVEVRDLLQTSRGSGGWGSTGK